MKTSKSDFIKFKKYARKWTKKLGLSNWDIAAHMFPASESKYVNVTSDPEHVIAWTGIDEYVHRVATLYFNSEYNGVKVSEVEIEKAAFHELCHLLLRNIHYLASQRFGVQEETIDMEIHSLIATLENVFFANS